MTAVGKSSAIEWTDHTFNIVWGCEKVSPACTNCYAAEFSRGWPHQHDGTHKPLLWGPGSERKVLSASYWRQPLSWDRAAEKAGERQRVFCSSMADVFEDHPTVNEQRARLWRLIDATPNLDWLLLTKRPENLQRFLPEYSALSRKNIWLGVTAENQKYLDLRVPKLLMVPAAVHFISYEPGLGPLNAAFYLDCQLCHGDAVKALHCKSCYDMPRIDWVICGGESGATARPLKLSWARSIRDQVVAARKSFFFKQWGEWQGHEVTVNENGTQIEPPLELGRDRAKWEGDTLPSKMTDWKFANGDILSARVGKVRAGRLLDGRTWDQIPVTDAT